MKNKLIGVVGFIGSGKDTIGSYLIKNYQFEKHSFANSLKDAVSSIFGWDRGLLEGVTEESRKWRESVDTYWSCKLGKEVTPRWVLQHLGTTVMRNHFDQNIWLYSLEKKITSSDKPIVITDVRFPNEIQLIENAGGRIIWITRGCMPEWYDTAINDAENMKTIYPHIHPSEYSWLNVSKKISIISNNSTLEELYFKIDRELS